MRFLIWVCRVLLTVVIAAFVTTVFYMTHSVSMPEGAKAALNWITVAGTALLGLSWPLMRRYFQALLLLVGLGVARALFGVHPALPSQETQLLTNFQSDFLWVSIGVAFVALAGTIATRAIMSDRRMRAARQAASTASTGQYLTAGTTEPQKAEAPSVPEVKAPEVSETVVPPQEPEGSGTQAPEDQKAEEPTDKSAAADAKKK